MKQLGNQLVSSFRDHLCFDGLYSQAAIEQAGASYLNPVFKNGNIDGVVLTIVPMAKGINDCFSECRLIYLRDIHSSQTLQPHTDMNVLQDIFLSLCYQVKNISLKVLHIDGECCVCCAEYRATQPGIRKKSLRLSGEQYHRRIEQFPINKEFQLFKSVMDGVIFQP